MDSFLSVFARMSQLTLAATLQGELVKLGQLTLPKLQVFVTGHPTTLGP